MTPFAARALLVMLSWPGPAPRTPASPAPSPDAPLTLDEAIALARTSNLTMAAARLRRAVDQAGIAVARERPNPEARYERTNELPHDALSVAQLLEVGGKRSRRIAVAEAVARTGEAERALTDAEVTAEVRLAFFELAGAQRRLEVAREIQELAGRARRAAAARHEVGSVSRLDVLEADVAFFQAENEATAVAGEREAARMALNALVGRDIADPTSAVDSLEVTVPDVATATAAAVSGNTALAVLDRQVAEAQARAALARAERVPDPTIEGTVTHGAESEFTWGWRAAVAVVVPVFTRHDAQVRVEEATLAMTRAQRDALAQRIRGVAASAAARASAEQQQYLRYRDEILPKNREVEAMAEESYRAGQTNLIALLQALQAARELRAKAVQAAADFEAALGALQQAMSAGPK